MGCQSIASKRSLFPNYLVQQNDWIENMVSGYPREKTQPENALSGTPKRVDQLIKERRNDAYR